MTDTNEGEVAVKKDVVPSQYREKYKETGGTCGDFIAEALSKVAKDGVESLGTVKAENDIPAAKWASMNPGMQRMNLANTLRATYLRGETIKILGREFNVRHQSEDFGEVENTPASIKKLAEFVGLQTNDRTVAALTKTFFPPENKSAILKAQREEAKEAKATAKALEKATKEATRAEAALTKATEGQTAAQTKLDEAEAKLADAEKAASEADEKGKAKADKAVTAAKGAVDKAKAKVDAAAEKVTDAQSKVDEAKAAVEAATPASTEADAEGE